MPAGSRGCGTTPTSRAWRLIWIGCSGILPGIGWTGAIRPGSLHRWRAEPMGVMVRTLDAASEAAWDRFVAVMPGGTFFHRAGWAKVIESAFGHATHFSFAERDGAITGVLPLGRVKTMLFGDALISVPFCVYGGPVAADAESETALITHAESLLARTGAQALEFRGMEPGRG